MRPGDEGSPHVTARPPSGPRRSRSVNSDLRQSRLLAIFALAAFAGAAVSDATSGSFWGRHTMLAGLVASVIKVMLSVGVINEVLERRRRQRWSTLAQYVLFELVRNAADDLARCARGRRNLRRGNDRDPVHRHGAEIIRDTARLTAAVQEIVSDNDRRNRFHREIAFLAEHADVVLGRWAAVMLSSEIYAEVIDRHVELAGDIAWIGSLLDTSNPPVDFRRQQRARSNPAVEIEANLGNAWLADRIAVITQLAEALDRGTLELALRIVPVAWWQARLRTTV